MYFTRYEMYKKIFSALDLPLRGNILGVSGLKFWRGSKHYTPPFPLIADDAVVTEAHYPDVRMEALPYADNMFDVVIADQVIEHIEGDVQKAIEETRRVLKIGGIAIIATVFIQPIHWGPKDMWRFSPDALRYLCRSFSEVIQCEGWGNRWAHAIFFLYPKSRTWQIPERKWSIRHLLATMNDDRYPQVTWIIARK